MRESAVKPGRNALCPCGSGRKHKHCCGRTSRPALGAGSSDLNGLLQIADATNATGRPHEAVVLYQQALERDPKLIEAQNNLGNAYLRLERFADAAECFRKALRLDPRRAQIHCNLGNAQRQLGQLADAVASFQQATAIDPSLGIAHHHLGLTLSAMGRTEEAITCYRRALAIDHRHVDVLNLLGDCLRAVGRRAEALPFYARAVESDPQRVDSHWNLGTVLFELRRTPEVAACYARALALQPDHAPSHLSMGLVLRQQRRPEDAEASCRTALAIEPNYLEALAFLGELLADRGQFAEAEELFKRTLDIDPNFVYAYFSIATHRKMTVEDGAWREGAVALLAKQPPLGHRISLHYALGKYWDDVREYDTAFHHFRQANELTKQFGSTYDREKLAARVDGIISTFTTEFLRCHTGAGATSERPIFIVGMPRSGTSLAEQILASHPGVFGAGELPFWDAAYGKYRKAELAAEGAVALIQRLAADYLDRLPPSSEGTSRVVDKMPANFLHAGLIHCAFPRARIIHMQRHPIDTCLSIYFQHFFAMGPYANDLDNLAHYYREYRRISAHWRAALPASALLEIPYEGLIEDQEGWTRRMLEFVGLPWDPACLEFHRTDRVVITASKWQVRQKIHSASAGRWLNYEKHVGPLVSLLEAAARAGR